MGRPLLCANCQKSFDASVSHAVSITPDDGKKEGRKRVPGLVYAYAGVAAVTINWRSPLMRHTDLLVSIYANVHTANI